MRTAALFLLLASTSLLACPDLSGKYAICRSQDGETTTTQNLTITQSVQNRAMTYVITSLDESTGEAETETYRATGKTTTQTERDPESGITMSLSTSVSCLKNSLVTKMVLVYGGEIISTLTTSISKQDNRLIQSAKGSSMGEDINETIVCE